MAKTLKAIVRKNAPRMIIAITTDENPQVGDNVEAIDIPSEPNYQVGSVYKILKQDLTFRDATEQEIDDADVDPVKRAAKTKQKLNQLMIAMEALIADVSVPQTVKDFVVALKRLY